MALRSKSGATGFDNNPSCSEPAGAASGDWLYAVVYQMYSTGVFTPPSADWTQVGASQIQGDAAAALFKCLRGASSPGYTWTSADAPYWAVQVACVSGRDAAGATFESNVVHQFVGFCPYVFSFTGGIVAAGTDILALYGITINGATLTCTGIACNQGTGTNEGGQEFGPSATDIGFLANIAAGPTGTMTSTLDSSPSGAFSDGAVGWAIALPAAGGGPPPTPATPISRRALLGVGF